ncbi:GNAT family N-acetyltransferase [Oceanobacillus neutriphilus]|uniref:N-acetyltransferase n=1 Tax=Oceanobacillus neutriphilus TaxID=531815 RepID=A0ABQ2NT18_9BACI|nr:GNAT family N-acetyltransferase [Oceanobacillus neutriphilus]GGP10143.1 N-acetyltransferase [Oceanobacillus neutriphilus]
MTNIKNVKSINDIEIHPSLKNKLKTVQSILQSDKHHELFIAEKDGKAIGLALSWLNSFHPSAKYIRFFAVEDQDQNVYIHKLLTPLLESTASQYKWIYSCYSSEIDNIAIMEEKGFQLFRRTFEETFGVTWMLQNLDSLAIDKKITPLKEVMSDWKKKQQFLTKIKSDYEQTHADNPVESFTLAEWEEILKNDCPDENRSSVLFIEEEIAAYIMLHPGDTEYHYEIGWVGAGQTKQDTNLLKQLLFSQLQSLKDNGVDTVEIEVDSTNPAVMSLFDFLKLNKRKSWNSYILK